MCILCKYISFSWFLKLVSTCVYPGKRLIVFHLMRVVILHIFISNVYCLRILHTVYLCTLLFFRQVFSFHFVIVSEFSVGTTKRNVTSAGIYKINYYCVYIYYVYIVYNMLYIPIHSEKFIDFCLSIYNKQLYIYMHFHVQYIYQSVWRKICLLN